MPEWVKNKIEIWGNNISERIEKKYFSEATTEYGAKVNNFDFDKVIPMPKTLNITSGYITYEGMKLYLAQINPTIQNFGSKKDKLSLENFSKRLAAMALKNKSYSPKSYLLSPSEVETRLARLDPGTINTQLLLGKAGVENIINYGCPTWLEWRDKYWNTKWNAQNTNYETMDNNYIRIEFLTPWSEAFPVVRSLCKQLTKNDRVAYTFAHEDKGFNVGFLDYVNGEEESCRYNNYTKEAYETSFDLWGGEDEYYHDKETGNYIPAHDCIQKLTEEIGMEWIDGSDAAVLINKYCNNEKFEKHELKDFCWMEKGKYCALYNADGCCFAEEYVAQDFIDELINTRDLMKATKLAEDLVTFKKDYDYYDYMDGKEVWESEEDVFKKYVAETKKDIIDNNGNNIRLELGKIMSDEEPNKGDPVHNDFSKRATDLYVRLNKFTLSKTVTTTSKETQLKAGRRSK